MIEKEKKIRVASVDTLQEYWEDYDADKSGLVDDEEEDEE